MNATATSKKRMLINQVETDRKPSSTDVLEELYREHFVAVHSLLWRVLNNHDRAIDLAQECFLACLRKSDSKVLSHKEMKLYLFGTARNLVKRERYRHWIRLRSRTSAETELEEGPDKTSPAESLYQQELSEAVRTAVHALPRKLRWIVVLREYQNCSYQEISSILKIPIGTVRSRLHRARHLLAERLSPFIQATGDFENEM